LTQLASVYLWLVPAFSSASNRRDGNSSSNGRPASPASPPRGLRSDTEVIARARRALADGPLDDVQLLGQVLALPGAPPVVAARIAESLFGRQDGFSRTASGSWELRCAVVADDGGAMLLRQLRFAVVDVETTGGGGAQVHRITEVAVVPVTGGEVGEPWTTLVNPMRSIPPQIVALTRITAEMVARAPTFRDVADEVVTQLKGRLFVAHNATFDWGFVSREVDGALGVRLDGDRLCTLRLARLLLPQLKRRSLDALSYYFGIENTGRHRAWGDALATARLLGRLIGVAEEQGLDTWAQLMARLDRRTARAKRRRRALPRPVDYDTTA
jgi:DNA polymerase-3 subunit epsilon